MSSPRASDGSAANIQNYPAIWICWLVALVMALGIVVERRLDTISVSMLVVAMSVWPLLILAPARWRGALSEQRYLSASFRLLAGAPGLAIAAAFATSAAAPFPRIALVFGVGAIYYVVVARLWRVQRGFLSSPWLWVSASVAGIEGVLADLPEPLGWNTLAFVLYALCAFGAVSMALLPTAELKDSAQE